MVITGAGGGVMSSAQEGAGGERSFGLNIRLPFEQEANPWIADDPKLVSFKYFFTRKLFLVREAHAMAFLPGGFGTADEAFEALTLIQTGKSPVLPLVMLDEPGGTYWKTFDEFIRREMVGRGTVSPNDPELYRVTDDVEQAAAEVEGFYKLYHSQRYVRDALVLRIRRPIAAGRARRSQRPLRRHPERARRRRRRGRSREKGTSCRTCRGWCCPSTARASPASAACWTS